jgi:N-acetylneuraminic acid mutarotase
MRRSLLALIVAGVALTLAACAVDERAMTRPARADLAGGWADGPRLNDARAEIAAAVLDGRIYTGGGFDAQGADLTSFEVLDPATGAWELRAPIPLGLNHLGNAALGGAVYVSGGYARAAGGAPSPALFAYDPAADSWSRRADMPLRRGAHVMVAAGGRLYVIGGVGDEPLVTLAYDPAADAWSRRAPFATEREHLSAAVVDDRVYVIGGRWGGRNTNLVEEYDPAADRWQTKAPLPTARGGLTAAALDGRIHVLGGEAFDPNRTFPEHEVYTPGGDAWERAPPPPTARHGLASAGLGGRLYVIGGGRTAGLSVSDLTEIFTPE